ncbi:MAG: EamA family transporter [Halothiobacillaceae bacterium]
MVNGGVTLVVLAAFFWGVSGGLGGMLIAGGWDPSVVSFYRGAVGLLFVLVWLLLRRGDRGLASGPLWFWSVVAGLGVAGNFSFYFLSIAQGSVAVAATLMYCAPVFVYLISFAIGWERSTVSKWLAIAGVLVGIVLLTQVYDLSAMSVTPLAVAGGLLAGLSYAVFIFGFKCAAPHGSPQAVLSIAFAVLCLVLVWPADIGRIAAVFSSPDLPVFVALGVLGAGISFVLYVIGLNHAAPAVAAIVATVEPVTAALFGVAVLDESLTMVQVLGMGLILLTVMTLSAHGGSGRSSG